MNTDITQESLDMYYEAILNFCLFDDSFARCVFKEKECVELLLSHILGRKVKVIKHITQYDLKNLYGRSACADIYAQIDNHTFVIVEIERKKSRAHPKRASYYLSLLNSIVNKAGDKKWTKMPKIIVIVICEKDYFGEGKQMYISRQTLTHSNIPLGDEAKIIYVNGQCKDNSPVGRLMHDFACTNADDMYYKELAERVRYYKESEEGEEEMCKIMKDIEKRGEKRGKEIGEKQGKREGRIEMIRNLMRKKHLSALAAMDMLDIPKRDQKEYLPLLQN